MENPNIYILPSLDRRAATGWQARASCTGMDPEIFFPPMGGSVKHAQKVCRSCPVRRQCLEYSLANQEMYGVWGGVGEKTRQKMMWLRGRKYLIEKEVEDGSSSPA